MSSNTNKQSSSSSGAVNNNSSKAPSSDRKSDYRLIKDAGFNNMNHMMQSYGLKMSEHEDIQEARAILDGFRKIDEANGRK
jgi:inhibitor of KinA sporulation pathway (predicted exonuclease)